MKGDYMTLQSKPRAAFPGMNRAGTAAPEYGRGGYPTCNEWWLAADNA